MRPKAFKPRAPIGAESDYVKASDGRLDAGLATLVRRYRARICHQDNRARRDEIRETLRRLSVMQPSAARDRWSKLDSSCRAEIAQASLLLFRRAHGDRAEYLHSIACPDDLPGLAGLALQDMKQEKPGRPRVTALAVEFAGSLAEYWTGMRKQRPIVRTEYFEPTEFQQWAASLFKDAGFPIGDIRKNLRDGVRAARVAGRIPR